MSFISYFSARVNGSTLATCWARLTLPTRLSCCMTGSWRWKTEPTLSNSPHRKIKVDFLLQTWSLKVRFTEKEMFSFWWFFCHWTGSYHFDILTIFPVFRCHAMLLIIHYNRHYKQSISRNFTKIPKEFWPYLLTIINTYSATLYPSY